MNQTQLHYVLWGGVPLLAVIALAWFGYVSAASLDHEALRAQRAHDDYERYYEGDGRMPAADVRKRADATVAVQDDELQRARNQLVPGLPEGYRTANFNRASELLQRNRVEIRALAERSNVALPAELPMLDGQISNDPSERAAELARLYLLREALYVVIPQSQRITRVENGSIQADPTGRFVVLATELELECSFRAASTIMEALCQHSGGLGLYDCRLQAITEGDTADQPSYYRFACTVTLLCEQRDDWSLRDVPTNDAVESRSSGSPVRSSRSRFRR